MVESLISNQIVVGSSPIARSRRYYVRVDSKRNNEAICYGRGNGTLAAVDGCAKDGQKTAS